MERVGWVVMMLRGGVLGSEEDSFGMTPAARERAYLEWFIFCMIPVTAPFLSLQALFMVSSEAMTIVGETPAKAIS